MKTLQQQADRRLAAAISADNRAEHPVQTASAPLPPLKAIPVATLPQWSVQPGVTPVRNDRPPIVERDRRPPRRRVYIVTPPIMLARFVANLQHDIGALFR